MTKSAMVHSRQTSEFKEKAEAILREVGIPLPSAYELFYRQIIAYHGLPFDDRVPTKETIQAMQDARKGKGKKYDSVASLFQDLGI